MSGWLRHTLAWVAILAFALGAKLHLPVVQLAAWTTMAAGYAEVMPLEEAVRAAVAGEELCGGCRFVRSAEHAKQAGDALLAKALGASADLLPAPEPDAFLIPAAAAPARHAYPDDEHAGRRHGAPEPPPPRA